MRKIFYTLPLLLLLGTVISLHTQSCQQPTADGNGSDSLAMRQQYAESPVLSPAQLVAQMQVEKGFTVEVVAAEPLIQAPVAMTFDESGRIWAVEMHGYMPDTAGTGEEAPSGKIVILSDANRDGTMDQRTVFLDSLVLPRAICLIENGILVGASPNLWFYEIINDKPVKRTLVDAAYTEGGNVEHEPNGLLRALDNWIYNAKSNKRYRKRGDQWEIEKTHFRGQWGITQDDDGRLYYNTNSNNLLGDLFSPGLGAGNSHQKRVAGFSEDLVPDNKVYPIRPTPGVNRGYLEGILDNSLKLVNFTAACSPLIYSGALFSNEYHGNAFVAEPAANLVKRNVLEEKGYKTVGRQAYTGKEFLASKDERFRPVFLANSPDGGLYITDMYRGIIQHKAFLTPYLKKEIEARQLVQPLNCGRIYKVVPSGSKASPVNFRKDSTLLQLLQHPNGWVRLKSQQHIIDHRLTALVPALQQMVSNASNLNGAIHALWTLEGLGQLQPAQVMPLLSSTAWRIRMQALSVLPSVLNKSNYQQFLPHLQQLAERDTLAAPYIGFLAASIKKYNAAEADKLLSLLTEKYSNNIYVADAVISNLKDREALYQKKMITQLPDTSVTMHQRLAKVLQGIAMDKQNKSMKELAQKFPQGVALYKSTCQPCHGGDGNGVAALAPPLKNSEWVVGNKNKLISIVLYGLTGPIQVNKKLYKAPEINGDMPGLAQNASFSDNDLAQILSFIRQAWGHNASAITGAEVQQIRSRLKGRQKPFTMEELKEIK